MNEALIEFIPVGYRYSMIGIAVTKRALGDERLPAGEKLDLLEKLHGYADGQYITPAMLAVIEPASNAEVAIVNAAVSLDGDSERGSASYNVLVRDEVFSLFRSVFPAIQMREGGLCRAQA